MIIKTTKTADVVLAIIDEIVGDGETLLCQPYQNGREHGWSLYNKGFQNQVSFSQDRGSDKIVVYEGAPSDFSPAGNAPNDKVYQTRKEFRYDAFVEAARYIVAYLVLK